MTNEKTVKEPLIRIVKREGVSVGKNLLINASAIIIALLITSLFCSLSSTRVNNPLEMFSSMFTGVFGSSRKIWTVLRNAALLLGVSLALLPAFRMKFWNLGANGQIVIASLVAFAFMRYGHFNGGSNVVVMILATVCSIGAGILWAVIPAVFKAFFRTNETLFTLMMNYIAQGLVTVMITVWEPKGSGSLSPIDDYALFDIINPQFLTILVVAIITVIMYFYLTKSKHGYELSVVGESENTARYAGINVKKVAIRTLVLSGAICGIIGLLLTASINHTVSTSIHKNMGFTAIMSAWLANFNPLVTIGTSFLIIFISTGMAEVRQNFGFTNDAIGNVALGLIYFFIIACQFFVNYKIVFRGHKEKTVQIVTYQKKAAPEQQAKTDEKGGNN